MLKMRFDDDRYVNDYLLTGKYPKIHQNIIDTVNIIGGKGTAIDLGCCTGLLSAWLLDIGFEKVFGVEGNEDYLTRAVKRDGIVYEPYYITYETLNRMEKLLQENKVEMVVSRRIFPEIGDTGGVKLVRALGELFYKYKVPYITLEGRLDRESATNILHNADKEVEQFTGIYKEIHRYKNCRILERVK